LNPHSPRKHRPSPRKGSTPEMYNPLHALFTHNSHASATAVADVPPAPEDDDPAPIVLTSVGEYRRQHPERQKGSPPRR
jgi:hypothetical protein